MMNLRASQKGVSLIEVLVAVFLLMIGLLGIMGVQVFSQRQVVNSAQRSIVVQATQNMIERMRANNVGTLCGRYVTGGMANLPASCGLAEATLPNNQAATDLTEWRNTMGARLNGLTATVTGPIPLGQPNAGNFLVTVVWQERDGTVADPGCPVGTPAQSRCFITTFLP